MSNTRSTLVRGPGYMTVGSATTPSTTTDLLQFTDDFKAVMEQTTEPLVVSTQGVIDETRSDAIVKMSGTPLLYSPTQSGIMSLLFAQFGQLPVIGASLCGDSDTPVLFIGANGDTLGVYNVCCPKPPTLTLAVNKPLLGSIELHGLIRDNYDPETASSYYVRSTGSYASPILLQTGDSIGRQRYYGNWAAGNTAADNTNWTNFQGKEGIEISFEADWQADKVQERTVDYYLGDKGLRAMAKLIPIGPTMADIDACQQFQGAGAKHGSRLSANTAMGNVIFTGQNNTTITILNAVLKTAGTVFGGKPLRAGEIGLVGLFNMTATPSTGGITLA